MPPSHYLSLIWKPAYLLLACVLMLQGCEANPPLQGSWKFRRAYYPRMKPEPWKTDFDENDAIEFFEMDNTAIGQSGSFRMGDNNGVITGTYSLNITTMPHQITLTTEMGDRSGIFKIEGDKLMIKLKEGPDSQWPITFDLNDQFPVWELVRTR